ncbi:G-protein-coupled receptor family 3 protein [Cavenderia fasciculata]|uniref:G-protein-coupled receptor family 3 protein n=1 Tax=Cavenderia fasciculata TaxID=261658 RepID=F4PJK6_CACFS|nr:G-protein-coupled receptor family 3 protein [Cavenderia fasciculata]EGG23780.1 G-protein-coupled receptor family 3 protein [Cavenderia fasciculata]|eukprot:XP_004361631.1 G-protein-coupled receptor family 3 protein [Cavenderia fasciculata]
MNFHLSFSRSIEEEEEKDGNNNNNNGHYRSIFFYFVNGEEYYISPSGIDENGCSSIENPCKSIQYATNIAAPFSTIILAPGTYFESNYSQISNSHLALVGSGGCDVTTVVGQGTGLLYVVQSTLTITGITFARTNRPTPFIYTFFSERDLNILNYRTNLNLVQRSAPIYLNQSIVHFIDCAITQFKLFSESAAIFSTYSFISMTNTTFQINQSNLIFLYNTTFTGGLSQFISNRGNLLITSIQSNLHMVDSIIAYNRYSSGIISDSWVNLTNVLVIKNFGVNSFLFGPRGSNFNIRNSRFIENRSNESYTLLSLNTRQATSISLSIIDGNSNLVGASIGTRSSGLNITFCEFRNQFNIMISLMGSSISLVQYCSFRNFSGNVFSSDSSTVLILFFSSFKSFSGKILDFYSKGSAYVISTTVCGARSQVPIFQLENSAYMLAYQIVVYNNSAYNVIDMAQSKLDMYASNISSTNGSSIVIGVDGYVIRMQDCFLSENDIQLGGGIFFLDQTGNITVLVTRFTRNRSTYGTIIVFGDPKSSDEIKEKIYFSHQPTPLLAKTLFSNSTFIGNTALGAGALVFYIKNVFINFTCLDCYMLGNRAKQGNLINSNYYSYTVSMASNVTTPIILQIVIRAKDYFGQRFQGSSEISYTAVSANPDFRVSGITTVLMNVQGVTVMYNIQLSGVPGSNYTLFFASSPRPIGGNVNQTITFRKCENPYEPHNVTGIFYCLKEKTVSDLNKIIVTFLVVVIGLLTLFCFGIVIVYWSHPIIRFSNQIFLCVILFGCCVLLASLITSFIVSPISCRLRSILLPMGLEIPVAALVVKQYRLWKIRKVLSFQLKSAMGNRYFITYTAAYLVIPTIVVVVACTFKPLTPAISFDTRDLTYSHICLGDKAYLYVIVFLIYALIFLFITCVLVFKTRPYRSSPGSFSEPTYLGILTYNYLIILLLLLPLRFSFPTKPNAQFLIVAVASLIFVLVTLGLLFVPKLIVLFKRRAVVHSLTKFIEAQSEELERNKDILQFYELYGNEEGILNFANPNIFSPDSTSGSTISYRSHKSFSSETINKVMGNVHDPSPQNIRITSKVVKNRGMYSFTTTSSNNHSSSVSNLSTMSDFLDDDHIVFETDDETQASSSSSSDSNSHSSSTISTPPTLSSSSSINLINPNSMIPNPTTTTTNNNQTTKKTKKSKQLKRLKKKLTLNNNNNNNDPNNHNNNNNNSNSNSNNGKSKSENNTPSDSSPFFSNYHKKKK